MLKLFGILALITMAYAALSRYPPQEKPTEFANQEGCYIAALNKVLPYEKPYYPDQKCERYNCQRNGETRWETCGAVLVKPGCRKSEVDLSKRYPDCCPTEVCH
ncbi:la1-like protein 15 [Cydia fagiglandana]|uniref:la1-like protein 15 n=1 Tax=Cydia fagiglandana TaxID=1458189 RepID=UPI002FEDEB82